MADSIVYYSPEKWGLEVVAELEHSDGNYCFDTHVAWRHTETGKVYAAHSSGCSCPCPFEEYDKLEDLDLIDSNEAYNTLEKAVLEHKYSEADIVDKQQFLRKVWDAAGLRIQVTGE